MQKWISTEMMKRYLIKLLIRIVVFISVFIFYLLEKDRMIDFVMLPIWHGITPIHVLWFGFMIMMLTHICPMDKLTMALRKAEKEPYQEVEAYSQFL